MLVLLLFSLTPQCPPPVFIQESPLKRKRLARIYCMHDSKTEEKSSAKDWVCSFHVEIPASYYVPL